MHAHLLQRLNRLRNCRQNRDAHVFDEHFLGRSGTALHTVENDHVSTSFYR
ncbi:hypothetical protein D3C81_2120960 [compost metagenome]